VSALHQPCVRDEVTDLWEAVDVVYLVEDHQGEDFTNTGDTAKQVNGYGIMFGNLCVDLAFDSEDLLVEGVQECDIHLDSGTNHRVGEAVTYTGTIGPAVYAFFERGQVVLSIGVLDVRLKLCMLTRKVQPAAKEIPCGAHLLWVHIGHGEHSTAKQGSDFLGVDLVVFHLSSVDRLHVQGMTQNELDADAAA